MTTPFQLLWLLGHTSVCRNVKTPAGTYKDQMLLEERVDASWHIRIMKALCSTISMVGYLRLWSRVQNRVLQSIWFVSKHGIYIYILYRNIILHHMYNIYYFFMCMTSFRVFHLPARYRLSIARRFPIDPSAESVAAPSPWRLHLC